MASTVCCSFLTACSWLSSSSTVMFSSVTLDMFMVSKRSCCSWRVCSICPSTSISLSCSSFCLLVLAVASSLGEVVSYWVPTSSLDILSLCSSSLFFLLASPPSLPLFLGFTFLNFSCTSMALVMSLPRTSAPILAFISSTYVLASSFACAPMERLKAMALSISVRIFGSLASIMGRFPTSAFANSMLLEYSEAMLVYSDIFCCFQLSTSSNAIPSSLASSSLGIVAMADVKSSIPWSVP